MHKNVRAGLASAVALSAVLGIAGVALADDPYPSKQQVQQAKDNVTTQQGSLAAVRKQLAAAEAAANAAGEQAEIAAERYNGALWKLGLAKKAAQKASAQAAAARKRVTDQRAGIANLVVRSYQDGTSLNTMTAMLGGGGPEEMMAKTGVVAMAGDSLQADYQRFLGLSAAAEKAESAARAAETKAAGIAASARRERAAAGAAAQHAQSLSDAVAAKRDEVVTALAKAQHTSIALANRPNTARARPATRRR